MLRRACSSLLVLAAVFVLAPTSSAQALDNLWFKVTASVKGGAALGGNVDNIKGKVVAYVFVTADKDMLAEGGGVATTPYDATVISEVEPDNWQLVDAFSFLTVGNDERVMVGPSLGGADDGISMVMELTSDPVPTEGSPTEFVRVVFTAKTKIKTDKEGAVKKASFKSLGGVVPNGISEGETLFGGAKLTGKSVDPSKLPFDL